MYAAVLSSLGFYLHKLLNKGRIANDSRHHDAHVTSFQRIKTSLVGTSKGQNYDAIGQIQSARYPTVSNFNVMLQLNEMCTDMESFPPVDDTLMV